MLKKIKDQEYTPICHGDAHNNNITNGQDCTYLKDEKIEYP